MTKTNFDRRKSKTRVFWLLFCSQKSDRKRFWDKPRITKPVVKTEFDY